MRHHPQPKPHLGGYVAQDLGDGVLAYFGWPEAHDNDAERAARAGLAILDAMTKLNEQATRSKLLARVGIDSGAVVVGAEAGKDADPLLTNDSEIQESRSVILPFIGDPTRERTTN